MKNILLILLYALACSNIALGQSKSSKDAKLEAHIIEIDKLAWKAWQDKNAAWFLTHNTEEFLAVTSEGVSNRAEMINSLNDCDVHSFLLENFTFVKFNKTSVIITYTATQDAVCDGEQLPKKIRASVNYVKRGGKWLEAYYMDTPLSE
jgi:hypothetical protein